MSLVPQEIARRHVSRREGVLLDQRGEPVAPVIAWHDTRDEAELDDLRKALDDAESGTTVFLNIERNRKIILVPITIK